MNNIFIDLECKTKIPQNKESYFVIKADEDWKYSIRIELRYIEEINYLNLFFIIKSFINNEEIPPYAICTSVKTNKKIIITQKENILWFKKIDYYSFIEWINFRITYDSKYENNDEFYGIHLLYSKNVWEIKKNIEIIKMKPIYPWTPEWLNLFKNQIEKVKLLEEELIYYKKK